MRKPRNTVAYGLTYHRVGIPRGKHTGVFPLARSLTEAQIQKARAYAVEHGLLEVMVACDRALAGSERGRVAVARWVLTGRAASR